MGYVMAVGTCFGCKGVFMYNPLRVPSISVNGVKEPICKKCVDRVNPQRKKNGVPEIVPHPDAYEAADEGEL
jgi:hypothetical protein